jgi:hypothetical protein
MKRGGAGRLCVVRLVLSAVVIVDLSSFFIFVGAARSIGVATGTLNAFNDLVSITAVRGAVVLLGIAAAVAFARAPGRLWAGASALVALGVLSTAHAQLFGSPWRHLFYSGLCLSGWLLGLALARLRGAPGDESYARIGSLALLSAAYLNAGISKLVYGGFDWLSGLPIQEVVVGQDGLVPGGILSVYRIWVATHPAVASLCSVATVGLELAAPLMLAGRTTRTVVALGLFAMHANIYLLSDILYWQSIVFLLLFGLSPDPPGAEPAPAPAAVIASDTRRFVVTAVLLVLCALVAVGHQGRRFAAAQTARIATGGVPVPDQPPPPTPLRQIGPFAVGDPIAGVWKIDAVDIRDGAILMTLSGPPGRAVFEMTCAASDRRGLFDLGAAHIFYSSDLPVGQLEAPGWALRAAMQAVAEDDAICERMASWRASARADGPP